MSKKNVHQIVSGAGWIGSFAGLLVDELEELGISFEEIHKLGKPTKEGKMLVRACAKKISEMLNGTKSKYLKIILGAEALMLNATDGSEGLTDANDTFSYIDSDFKNWGADQKGPATKETLASVCEIIKDGTFSQIFGSLSPDVRKLCWTPAQIKIFCKKHRQWLRTDGYGTFFLFESKGGFFVASVGFDSDGSLEVSVDRFGRDVVWSAGYRRRVVVPQLV